MLNRTARIGRRSLLAAAILLSASVCGRAAEPDVLDQVPGDAYVVIAVNNVRTFGLKLANAATRLDIPHPNDLIGAATATLGITKGFDANSSAAIVLLKPPAGKEGLDYFNGAPPAIILLPTSDPKGMLEPLSPKDPDASGISEVTLATPPGKGYVATVANKWIAFATNHDDLQAYLDRKTAFSKTVAPETLKTFESNDLVVWANVAKLGEGVDKAIEAFEPEIISSLDMANMRLGQDAFTGAVQRQAVSIVLDGVKQYFHDADAAMLTTRLTDSGVTLGLIGSFKDGSPFGQFIQSQASAKPASLAGLPDGPFLLAGATSMDTKSVIAVFDQVFKTLLADDNIAKDPRSDKIKEMRDLVDQELSITKGMGLIFLEPPPGKGIFNGVVVIDTSDAAKYQELQMQALKSGMVNGANMSPDLIINSEVSPDTTTVKDVKLTKVAMTFSLRPETPEKPLMPGSREGVEMIHRLYGPDGVTMYVGTVGGKFMVIYGSEPSTLDAAIDAVKSNTDNLSKSPAIMALKDQTVPNATAVAYFPITRWISVAQNMIMPGATPLPPAVLNAPPIAISAGFSGNAFIEEVHVPIAAIIGIRDATMHLRGTPASTNPGGMGGN